MLRALLFTLLLIARPGLASGETFTLTQGSSILEVELSTQYDSNARQQLRDWLEHLSASLVLAYGHWPRERWRIEVMPASTTDKDPIPWAQVKRGDIDRVTFYTAVEPDADTLKSAWTGYHELSHLLIPYRGFGDKWFSEGLASYYQNLLQARAGVIDEATMWQQLHDGFLRGQQERRFDGQSLDKLSGEMYSSGAFMRVYWSGAWYFLAADTRLRQQSGGGLGLDQALAALNDCCADQKLSVAEIVAQLDRLNRVVLFEPLYRQMRSKTSMPDHLALFRSLGIRIENDQVVLQELGPGARLRRAIAEGGAL